MSTPPSALQNARPLTRTPKLVLVSDTPKGRGVFASALIPKGTVIDISPVLILPQQDVNFTSKTILQHYTYYWPVTTDAGTVVTEALALGLGSMFNHSTLQQNVTWKRDLGAQCIVYTAHRDIEPGTELCISYGSARLWFEDANADAVRADDDYARIREKFRIGANADAVLAELELSGLDGIAIDDDWRLVEGVTERAEEHDGTGRR